MYIPRGGGQVVLRRRREATVERLREVSVPVRGLRAHVVIARVLRVNRRVQQAGGAERYTKKNPIIRSVRCIL